MKNSEQKNCQSCKKAFTIEPDDFAFYEKMKVPAPRLCPECRFKRRAQFRNEMMLYSRKCDLCGKSTVSMFSPKGPYTVYCNDCWASDKWDAYSYGHDYDPTRPFFEQLGELSQKVPKPATYSSAAMGPNINSEYTNFAGANKDCYLCFNSGPRNENCGYSRGLYQVKDSYDNYLGEDSEKMYECINFHKNSGVMWGQNIVECLDSLFLFGCSGCQNCLGCVNLRNKNYHILNKSVSKEEYEKRLGETRGSYSKMKEFKEEFEDFISKFPRRQDSNIKVANSDGEYLFECKNVHHGFEITHSEDAKYVFSNKFIKDSYDLLGHGRYSELLLEGVGVGTSQRIIAGWFVEDSHDVDYSFATRASEYCFGCDGVKGGKYVILNKRYNKDEYEKIRKQIVNELKEKNLYGLFMPSELALFAYNETIAQDNMPLTKEEALAQGFRWEENLQMTTGKETMKSEEIPDHIKDVPDSILSEILACVSCKRNYKIIPAELQFYKQMILPIPRQCFFCRHKDRLRRRGLMKVFDRNCMKCEKQIKTSYPPGRPEIIYCVDCYQKEVI